MQRHHSSTRLGHLAAFGAVLAVALGSLTSAVVAASTATQAGASGQTVTYSANTIRPGALPSMYAQTTLSDGWGLALTTTQVFAVTHHQSKFEVSCWNQSNAALCWPSDPTKVVTNGAGDNFATSPGEGLWMNQATGRFYAYAVETNGTEADDTAGVVCVNTLEPSTATGAQLFCGFTPLSARGDATFLYNPLISAPALVGSNWYAFNNVINAGVASGTGSTQNTLLCFDVATLAACADQPFTVPMGGITVTSDPTPPPIGSSGGDVFIPTQGTIDSAAATELGCFDTQTESACASPWPLSVADAAGSPYPLLTGSAQQTGVCLPITGNPCWTLAGASVATPPNMASVIGETNHYNGPAVVSASTDSIYVANNTTTAVDCYDYATERSCANFPKALTNMGDLYTVNTDPNRPNCLWINSDHGIGQIQNFNATTGGACAPGPIRLQTSSLVQPQSGCQPTGFQSLQITSPPVSSYGSGSVQFANPQGTIDTSIPAQPINSFGVVNLNGLNFSSDPSPQFVITLNGLTSTPTTVSLRLTWYAAYGLSCIAGGQTVSNQAGYWMVASDGGIFNYGDAAFFGSTGNLSLNKPIVGIAVTPTRYGYWLVASDGGIFAFGDAQFYGSTGNLTLNKPIVGMAPTPDGKGYWLVASDGGIFAYGDARFYGSTGNLTLNKPIVGMASTPDGGGYWLVASDGGIFAYGDAQFYGSTGNLTLNKPIVAMAANPNGGGYWMVASDGGIFNYGTSGFFGSTGSIKLNKPIVGMATNFNGTGYWLAASDGGIFNYGASKFAGSAGSLTLNKPIVNLSA